MQNKAKALFIFLTLFCHTVLADKGPTPAELLKQNNIDPALIITSITPYKQKVAYKMEVSYDRDIEGTVLGLDYLDDSPTGKQKHQFYLIFNPYTNYGIDLRLQVAEEDLALYSEREIKKQLDQVMGLQFLLKSEILHDEDSLNVVSRDGDDVVISYMYNVEALPKELEHYQYIQGFVHIEGGELDKIELKNVDDFELGDALINSYHKILHFVPVQVGDGAYIKDFTIELSGTENGQEFEDKISGFVLEYYPETDNTVPVRGGMQLRQPVGVEEGYETIYVDLDRTFPIWGKEARKKGYDLPKPFGVSFVTLLQDTQFDLTSFELNGVDVGGVIGGDDAKVENRALALLVRADMWLFPFMNVGLLLGESNTTTDITLQRLPGGIPPFIPPGDYFVIEDARSSSTLVGLGTTLAGGEGNFFGTVDFQYLTSYTEAADTTLDITIITPVVGYNFQDYG
ncbi:MAG: hypothetical protein R3312_03725, partial [Gammaproteobacteria bacterium]|nr:hypothetical protein [Gammaproteobacteria bacterium]